FDAWSTRHVITTAGAQELNPLLKPFAGNASLYAAIQVGPALLDFAGKKMMYNRHSWVRHMWWVPQSASFVTSIFCGAHNLAYHCFSVGRPPRRTRPKAKPLTGVAKVSSLWQKVWPGYPSRPLFFVSVTGVVPLGLSFCSC